MIACIKNWFALRGALRAQAGLDAEMADVPWYHLSAVMERGRGHGKMFVIRAYIDDPDVNELHLPIARDGYLIEAVKHHVGYAWDRQS